MHFDRRERTIMRTGGGDKTAVLGILQRSRGANKSRLHARVIRDTKSAALHPPIEESVEVGSVLYTDRWRGYWNIQGYAHYMIDHAIEYVNGRVHTNGIENFWSLLKRSIKGTYISVEPFHLGRYVDEQVFRFNEREGSDADRFTAALRRVMGKRLTYRELTSGTIAAAA